MYADHRIMYKRLLTYWAIITASTLTLYVGAGFFKKLEDSPVGAFQPKDFLGQYRRNPIENEWHEVTVVLNYGALQWQNAAGVTWSLNVEEDELRTGQDCPYGAQVVHVQTEAGCIQTLWFNGEAYHRA